LAQNWPIHIKYEDKWKRAIKRSDERDEERERHDETPNVNRK
jgi:hypothetical protein